MRILILSHMYPSPVNEIKGIFVHQQNLALREQGVDTAVLAPKPWAPFPLSLLNRRWRSYAWIPGRRSLAGVEIVSPSYPVLPLGLGMAGAGRRMYGAVRREVFALHKQAPFDLIHAHTALPDGQAGLALKRQLGIPLVVTVHGKDVQQTVARNRQCRRTIGEVVRGADGVIAVSTKIKGLLDEISGLPEKTVVINNGFETAGYDQLRRAPIPKSIISVSNLVESKGLVLNIRAVARLRRKYPGISYTVVGSGPAEANMRQLAVALGVADIVHFTGGVANSHVPALLARAEIFSLPSRVEAFGIAYLEAMAAGLPVIGCRGEGIEDVIQHGDTGLLVETNSVDQLTEALDDLLTDPGKADLMGRRGRILALDKFSWRENVLRLMELYTGII